MAKHPLKRDFLRGVILARAKAMAADFRRVVGTGDFLLYLLNCLVGAALCYCLYVLFPSFQFSWSIVSVLLVLAPAYKDSIKLSFDRIKANLTGASIGLVAFLLRPPDVISLCAAVLVTILVCTFFRLGTATRTALAALVVVLIQEKERNSWELGLQRMVAVVAGSLVALLLTFATAYIVGKTRRAKALQKEEETESPE